MLLDLRLIAEHLGFHLTGVLHLGAHLAEEAGCYYDLGVRNVVWVEGNPDLADVLRENLRRFDSNRVIIALVGDTDDKEVTFNVSNYDSMSSSVFEFGTHTEFSPDTVWVGTKQLHTQTIDSLDAAYDFTGINFLAMDLQGAELLALRGGENFLKQVDVVYSEVNTAEVYVGCAKFHEIGTHLTERGFRLVMVSWDTHGWGDAIWKRK